MRVWIAAFGALVMACDGRSDETAAPGGDDAGDAGSTSSSAICTTPVAGTAPFAVTLSGKVPTEAGVEGASVQAYFPHGRVAGAEVVVSMATYGNPFFAVGRGHLDASLGAHLEVFDPDCGDSVRGSLVGPSGGLDAEVSVNLSGPATDALEIARGRAWLCPDGHPPSPSFPRLSGPVMPTGNITIVGNTPIDVGSLASVKSSPPLPLSVKEYTTGFSLSVNGTPFEAAAIDLSGVREVMGAPLGLGTVTTLALSAVVTDPTFATSPPAGATIGSAPIVSSGVLHVPSVLGDDFDLLVALGDARPSKKLRLRDRLACAPGATAYGTSVSVVSEGGVVVPLLVECADAPVDRAVDLPEAGRWALHVRSNRYASRPCNYPGGTGPSPAYELDEFTLE